MPVREPWRLGLVMVTLCSLLGGCVSSAIVVGAVRHPIPVAQVQVYVQPPAASFTEIAYLYTSSEHSWSFTDSRRTEVVIERLKKQAAGLGANGLLLQAIGDRTVDGMGAGVGAALVGTHGYIGAGYGVAGSKTEKIGRATAIYLPPPSGKR